MVKARCPTCDTLQEIVCTGERQGSTGTSQWWTIVMHKKPNEPEICPGSGKKV